MFRRGWACWHGRAFPLRGASDLFFSLLLFRHSFWGSPQGDSGKSKQKSAKTGAFEEPTSLFEIFNGVFALTSLKKCENDLKNSICDDVKTHFQHVFHLWDPLFRTRCHPNRQNTLWNGCFCTWQSSSAAKTPKLGFPGRKLVATSGNSP